MGKFELQPLYHTVQPGESLSGIADLYYGNPLEYRRIYEANRRVIGENPDALAMGMVLEIPSLSQVVFIAQHTVAPGDSLHTIAEQFYGTPEPFMLIYDANDDVIGKDPDNVQVGQVLRIPNYYQAKFIASHTVQPGDSLSAIARKYYGDAEMYFRIYEANRETIGDNPNNIQVGQELRLP